MKKDWRLTNQMEYLHHATLMKADYISLDTNDHEHCEFCWSKFGEGENLLKSGYCTLDRYRWICNECFQDFRELFSWHLAED